MLTYPEHRMSGRKNIYSFKELTEQNERQSKFSQIFLFKIYNHCRLHPYIDFFKLFPYPSLSLSIWILIYKCINMPCSCLSTGTHCTAWSMTHDIYRLWLGTVISLVILLLHLKKFKYDFDYVKQNFPCTGTGLSDH